MDSTTTFNTMPQNAAGLGSLVRPMAQQVQSMGRGDDTMLVHMTPNEVNSLQGLALATGGSLTTNPETGLPEAGWLGRLLPSILGFGLNFLLPGSGLAIKGLSTAAQSGLMVGAGTAALTGDLSKGLMAGLGAFGGASLGGAVKGVAGAAPGAAAPSATTGAAGATAGSAATPAIIGQQAYTGAAPGLAAAKGTSAAALRGIEQYLPQGLSAPVTAAPSMANIAPATVPNFAAQQPGFLSRFGSAASEGMGGTLGKVAPYAAGLGLLNAVSPPPQTQGPKEEDSGYAGPYRYENREARYPGVSPAVSRDSSEFQYFTPSQPRLLDASGNPVGGFGSTDRVAPAAPVSGAQMPDFLRRAAQSESQNPFQRSIWNTFAKGGEVAMRDGSFVVDARTVSEIGNGSSEAGQEILARMGGRPVKGDGDGVSDSVPARIGGVQEARVARDEVIFPPEAVRRVGGGNEKRGTQKLYAMMERAHAARKKAERGQDTKLRRGLA
jgi:hypothetical protein